MCDFFVWVVKYDFIYPSTYDYFTLYFLFYLHPSLLWSKIQDPKLYNYSIQFLQG